MVAAGRCDLPGRADPRVGPASPRRGEAHTSYPETVIAQPLATGAFSAVRRCVEDHQWGERVTVSPLPAPTRIAPEALALDATVRERGEVVANGRLIVLHDPAGNESWQGEHRLVTMARADVDPDMAVDPLLAEVAWSWLTDALNHHRADHLAAAGTATTVLSRPFGTMDGDPPTHRVELRASWTPCLSRPEDVEAHLAAWQDLLLLTAGLPPLPEGVVPIAPRRAL